jgi:hypothetical protein
MHPLQLPPSDVAPHTHAEWRAAHRERMNEAALNAELLYQGLTYAGEEEGVEALRQILKMIEGMRIALELHGVYAPGIQFVPEENE